LCELSFDVFTTPERLRALERLERAARRLRAPEHALINQLGAKGPEDDGSGPSPPLIRPNFAETNTS
jgi:hypothetical protein